MTLKNIFRIVKRDSVSLITNMTGLSLGLAASILLTVFIQYELSFDKHFSKSDRIHRINSIWNSEGENTVMPICLREAFTDIPAQVPGIESAVQIYRGFRKEVVFKENRFKDLTLLYADTGFFQLFDLKLISGNLEYGLREINGVVLTESVAKRIFGTGQAAGESLEMDNQTFTVTAIVDNVPANTHFQFDMLMPMKSVPQLERLGGLEFFTYYLLENDVDQENALKTICDENTRMLTERFSSFEGSTFNTSAEELERLHLYTDASMDLTPSGSKKTIIIMLIIALTVMILALSNFINLFILNGAKRSKEIGIRKVNGAKRNNLILQFYMETTVVVTIAFLAGTLLSLGLIPQFGIIMQRESFSEIITSPLLYLILLAVYLATIIFSGLYPALLLSKSSPIPLILGMVNPAGDKKMLLRIVSIFQLSIAVFLLSALIGINTQTRFLKNLTPGYNPQGILIVLNLNNRLTEDYPALKDKLLNIPEIEQVAASGHTIGRGYSGQGIRMYGDLENQSKGISEYRIQPGLCGLYQFRLLNGRFLDPQRTADRSSVILNESAVGMLESTPQKNVGESVIMHSEPLEVIGVVEDFLYQSAAKSVEPLILTAYSERIRNICIRVQSGADTQKVLSSIDGIIKSFDEAYIMVSQFASDIYMGYYKREERLRNIVGSGSLLSVLIVLLGIFALISHNIISRTKEIGIRKVMGGSTTNMLTLIYFSSLKWIGIASLIALPLSWIYLNKWLNDYTVRIPLSWWIFFSSILLIVLFQSLITLGLTLKTARKNPIEALRYE